MSKTKPMLRAFALMLLCTFLCGCENHIRERWQLANSEAEAYNHAVDDFFAAVDARDATAIKELFTPGALAEDANMDETIQRLFAFYPGPTERNDRDGTKIWGDYQNNHGVKKSEIGDWFAVFSGGTAYYCRFSLIYRNDEDPEETGIHFVELVSEKVMCSDDFHWSNTPGLAVIEDVKGDYLTTRVGGYPKQYTPIDRSIAEADILQFLEKSTDFFEFKQRFGEPNIKNPDGNMCTYELASSENERLFANMLMDFTESGNMRISVVRIQNSESTLYTLWEEDG